MTPSRKWLALPALCLAFLGCHNAKRDTGLTPVTFQTDWYPQPEHGGFYEALLKGYYRQEGLDVTITPGGPYAIAEQQVSTGAAQFAMGSSDRVLEADSRGQSLVAVAATMQHDPQAIMVHADSAVRSFTDLEGRTPSPTFFRTRNTSSRYSSRPSRILRAKPGRRCARCSSATRVSRLTACFSHRVTF
jgi:ABC-type nitrate/sulfonate/bicarbonate transport system substrate-binding protein